jgi:hypothetical protein
MVLFLKKMRKAQKKGVFHINIGIPPTTLPAPPPINLQQNFCLCNGEIAEFAKV